MSCVATKIQPYKICVINQNLCLPTSFKGFFKDYKENPSYGRHPVKRKMKKKKKSTFHRLSTEQAKVQISIEGIFQVATPPQTSFVDTKYQDFARVLLPSLIEMKKDRCCRFSILSESCITKNCLVQWTFKFSSEQISTLKQNRCAFLSFQSPYFTQS